MADYKILTIPFARDAVPDMVNDIPNDPSIAEPQLASFKQGFPSITTIPLVAGGIPPEGQDFNGILRDITQHIVHQNNGGMYKFEADIVAAGGYPKGAVLSANDGLSLWVSLVDANVQDFNSGTPTQWARIAFSGLDALLDTKADKAVSINAGTGLTGGGNLSASRTLSVSFGTTAGTAAQGNDSRITGAAQKSANLSDLASPAAARTNLGLDALLDTKADKASFASSLTANGWQRLPSGLIIQWGSRSCTFTGSAVNNAVTFPIAFPNGALAVTTGLNTTNVINSSMTTSATSITTTSFNITTYSNNGFSANVAWIAIGY